MVLYWSLREEKNILNSTKKYLKRVIDFMESDIPAIAEWNLHCVAITVLERQVATTLKLLLLGWRLVSFLNFLRQSDEPWYTFHVLMRIHQNNGILFTI
jgi:hypothetical protein